MTIVSGFLSAMPASEEGARLARLSEGEGTAEAILTKRGFAVHVRVSNSEASDRVVAGRDDEISILIVGRPLYPDGEPLDLASLEWDEIPRSLRTIDGYWIAFAYDERNHRLTVLCDRLGVGWIYWAQVPGGVAFSSDFQALVRFLPQAPRLDDTACLLSLTLTYPIGDSTCFEGISLVSPDAALEFRDGRVHRQRLQPLEFGDRWAGASRAEKFEALAAALDGSFHSWSSAMPKSWAVALSSGKDSRYGLGQLLQHGERPSCVTFGIRGSPDVKGATAICRREGLRHQVFDFGARTSWQSWKSAVQRLGVVAGFQYVAGWGHEWRRSLRALNSKVVLGFLGDALSGSHLVDRFGGDWLANWEAWSLDLRADGSWRGSQMLCPEILRRARDVIRDAMLAETKAHDFPLGHQIALHLDLYSRQRRATASQINFLSDEVSIAPLFYSRETLDFWANLDYQDLQAQSLYLEFARVRFPRLFQPARRPSLVERAHGSLVNLAVGVWPGLRRSLKPQEIDVSAITRRHVDELSYLVHTCGDAVAHIVDLNTVKDWLVSHRENARTEADQLLRLWNLLLLLQSATNEPAAHEHPDS